MPALHCQRIFITHRQYYASHLPSVTVQVGLLASDEAGSQVRDVFGSRVIRKHVENAQGFGSPFELRQR